MSFSEFVGLSISGLSLGDIVASTPLRGGGNNRVFKLELRDGSLRVLKFYFRHPGDARDRLQAEFGALQFLWDEGVRSIPQPLGADRERGAALYGFIQGVPFSGQAVAADIDQALAFAKCLRALVDSPAAAGLPHASEAYFRWVDVRESIDRRYHRLVAAASAGALPEFVSFLQAELTPFAQEVGAWVAARISAAAAARELPIQSRTLSPSDFGFHNAIRGLDGQWVFQDFEYFGWDDPSKLIVDFMLHPGMGLTPDMQSRFCQGALEIFRTDGELAGRVAIAYPQYGLKWCMILLNEFVPESRARRGFAAGSQTEEELRNAQLRQLEKAKKMVKFVRASYEKFASSLS